jgi:hypothetical protein
MSTLARAFALGWAALPLVISGAVAQQVVNLRAADKPLDPQLQNVYKVGRVEGPAWELFGARVETQFDAAGNLYVFDIDNKRVVVVGPTGSLIRQIGKAGEGPGELRSPSSFAVMRDGTVVIADVAQRSFLIFNPQGTYTRSVQFGTASSATLGRLLADPRGGAIVSAGRQVVMMQQTNTGGANGAPSMPSGRPVVRYPLDGSASKQIFSAWQPAAPPPAPSSSGNGTTFRIGAARAFEPSVFSGILPDGGIVLSDSSAYGLKVLSPDGAVTRVLRRPLRPTPMTPAIQKQEKDRRFAELAAGGGPRINIQTSRGDGAPEPVSQGEINQLLRGQVEALTFYPEVPVVLGLSVGWTGKVWLERRGPDLFGEGPVDVLTPTGEYIGTIAPKGLRIPNSFGPDGLVAFVDKDAFEVLTVSVRRLPAALR